eukprot:7443709-Pyramimonas_sp.AAC.1
MIDRWRSWRIAAGCRATRAHPSSREQHLVARAGRALGREHRHQLRVAARRRLRVASAADQLAPVLETKGRQRSHAPPS